MESKEITTYSKNKMANTTSEAVSATPFQELKLELIKGNARKSFERVLGDKTDRFIQTIISVVGSPTSTALRVCDKNSIIYSSMVAAYTGLSLDPNLGQAALIPYGKRCTFQVMANGLIQLALRGGSVEVLNVTKVYEGDIKSQNYFTGDFEQNDQPHDRSILCGYMGYIRLRSGYHAYLYMTLDELVAHGKRYSKSYSSGMWTVDPNRMYAKTILKSLLKRNCVIDPYTSVFDNKIGAAIKYDEGVPDAIDLDAVDVTAEYPDSQSEEEAIQAKFNGNTNK
ncbi:MAG: recombinase RecT [Oscillospiraceae bacterium]